MTTDQIILFSLFGLVFVFLLWGRFRYDLVAFAALLIGALAGVVPKDTVFSGFGHPATIIVALVLVVSKGLVNSGAIDLLTRRMTNRSGGIGSHIALMSGIGGALSAFMNNVAALALLMPVEMATAKKAGRGPGLTLMPLAFATILGGMITLIGTPPNIIIASIREQSLGASFSMFDFAPVGLAVAIIGIIFVATIGWRLIPSARGKGNAAEDLFNVDAYIAELVVAEGSPIIGKRVSELDDTVAENNAAILGLVRRGRRLPGIARKAEIREGDHLMIEASPEAIDTLVGSLRLSFEGQQASRRIGQGSELSLAEVVVPKEARINGRSAMRLRLLARQGVTLIGVSRQGKHFHERVRKLEIEPGDILLLLGPPDRLEDVTRWLGCLPLAARNLELTQHGRAGLAAAIFAAAVAAASFGFAYLPVALATVVALYLVLDIVPLRQVYDEIEWPVVVLLGSMIPLGAALETVGGTGLIGNWIATATHGFPPVVALGVLLIATMTLSDVLNNTATAVVAAPIAIDVAHRLGVSPDPFLMAVAVGASCAFLTPIGHKNNTLVMGPGGYAFGDYWRMGLPLEIVVIIVAIPAILLFWPL